MTFGSLEKDEELKAKRCMGKVYIWVIVGSVLIILAGLAFTAQGRDLVRLNVGMLSLIHEMVGGSQGWFSDLLPDASVYLEQVLRDNPENYIVRRSLGHALLVDGKEDQAVEAWRASGVSVWDLIIRGEVERKAGRDEQALAWYTRAVLLDPESADAHYYWGYMHARKGHVDQAWAGFKRALALPSGKIGKSDIYYWLGKLTTEKADADVLTQALDYFNQAIVLDQFTFPFQKVDAHFQRALVYRQKGWNERALDELKWVIDQKPDHYPAHVRLGYVYWYGFGNPEQAVTYFTQAVEIDNGKTHAYLGLASVYEETGKTAKALANYQKTLQLDPDNVEALEGVGRLGGE